MKIALFGGSFDPPHLGHEAVIKEALQGLDIDKLIIMPTFINPFKNAFFADEKQRFLWCKKLWGGLAKVEISDFEIRQKRPVPSFESVNYLKKLYKSEKIYLIIGADHLATLHSWHKFDELCKEVEFIIAKRANIIIPPQFKSLETHIDISSSLIRNNLNLEQVCEGIKAEVKEHYAKFTH